MIIDTTQHKGETRPLSEYSDETKIKWFNEFYKMAVLSEIT